MSLPTRTGGGPAGSVTVDDTGQSQVQPEDKLRGSLEIQNNDGLDGGPSARCHLLINTTEDPAVFGEGIYLNPGGTYFMGTANLSTAQIKAVTDSGETTKLFFQVGR
jgi:hypothetical protein